MELRLVNAESNTGIDQLHRAIVEGSGKADEQTSEVVEAETLVGAPLIVASQENATSELVGSRICSVMPHIRIFSETRSVPS